ncbi:hypothetical protein DFH07DRAFT_570683 [Mycena maculata]|uniref:Uncharacterized protein n=1 Tax=Mycena maculata TaxID=230809 RepID=A0AAD7K4B6_9AGAR|nr:hypothetical protein DFH07DRAFT_570683 [Mycena maculata]
MSSSSSASSEGYSIFDTIQDGFPVLGATNSDEMAKALVEVARKGFDLARQRYWAGEPGPYVLDGEFSLATFEALSTTLESQWRLGYENRRIVLFGDPQDVHEEVTALINNEIQQGVDWGSHAEMPRELQGFRGQDHMIADKGSATRTWLLTSSSSPYCKEADALLTARTATAKENGVAIEIAHANESFERLCREIISWTTGEGERALLAIGLKINTKPPYQQDPQFWLVVRDSTPTSPSINCQVYDFGNGSKKAPHCTPHSGPATPTLIVSEKPVNGCNLELMRATDPEAEELIVELPVGAALFHDLQTDAFWKKFSIILSDGFTEDLKTKRWFLDLGYIRYKITDIIEMDAIQMQGREMRARARVSG